ncbi:NB-ARC domains-containing protein [Artemisia annua]|uniref:NB-ARC domains-containing protein n=1 Tax=Artemisia annua TaxID=35608 RepID=A0A2U1PBT3_ARTAN|nr:NB-ARC domains-containing protein [Artemisia annua]
MAATSVPHRWKYDVFVSFRDEDIRKSFMDHMFNDFKQKGIYAFRDDTKLPKGEEISPHLYKAIEESRFLIVIFSKNYASSSWCLRELVKILECKQTENPKHEVRIIFYDVKPNVVRKRKRSYAKAFTKHDVLNRAEVDKWREALSVAADLSGFNLQEMTNGYEFKFIDKISNEILKVISDGPLDVAENLVSVDARISGTGKTTLAKAIYNSMYTYFDGSCFCDDVQGVTKRQGLTQVQMQMFVKILRTKNMRISSVGEGTKVIKQRIASIRSSNGGSPDWFSPGSLIIFTGKDKQLLKSHKMDEIYEMEISDDYKALELFSLNAFSKRHPTEDFEEFAFQIVKYLHGHPLALKVIGRSLYGKSMHVWKKQVTEEVEVLVLLLKNNGQNIPIDGKDFTHMKNLRILKIYFPQFKELGQPFAVKLTGSLDFFSNELRLFYWHGCPFKYLPSDFYPENIVIVDLSYSNIKHFWKTPKCLRRLKVMKLRFCYTLTTTPDFSEIKNPEELNLEGCVNLVSVHPSIGMLRRLVALNLRDCKRLQNFLSRVEMDALQVLNLTGCLKINQLPEALGQIKSLTELHVDRIAITELPSFVSSLINLESLSFDGQGRIQPRWWTSITAPFGLLSKQQHPQRSVWSSLAGLHMLKSLNLSYCNLLEVPESIGGLSCLENLDLQGNNFTSLPRSLCHLSHLRELYVNGCKKLEVLPELPYSLDYLYASTCTSLREVSGSSKDPFKKRFNRFRHCPKLFQNVTIDSEGSISKTQCLDSSRTSQGFIHQLSAFLGLLGFQTNRCEFFRSAESTIYYLNIIGVMIGLGDLELVLFSSAESLTNLKDTTLKNFDGASLSPNFFQGLIEDYFENEAIHIQDSYMIWLGYTRDTREWKEAKNFVTFCFQENNENFEVKEFGVRLIYDEDLQQEDVTNLSIFQDLPTLSQHGGSVSLFGPLGYSSWSW